jgi:type II secretory pathway component PulK
MRRVPALRDGFALVTILWIIVAITVIGTVVMSSAREALALSHNRIAIFQQQWQAEACIETALALIDDLRATPEGGSRPPNLHHHFSEVKWNAVGLECRLQVEPAGSRIDLEAVDESMLRHLLSSMGYGTERADRMVDAFLDWVDPDDVRRPQGAEREWYDSRQRARPRNGPLRSPAELLRIRGFEAETALVNLLGFDEGPPVRGYADSRGASTLPGRRVLDEPAAWRVVARAGHLVGSPVVVAEVRIVLTSERTAVIARRMWLQ